jgi:hypothetical protein
MSSIHNVNFAMLILLNNTYNYSYIYKQIQCVLSAGQYVLKIYDHKCCNGRVWFLHEQFGFSLQYWHEQGFLLVWVLSLKWNLVQSSRFQCPHCKSKFSQKHNLKRHVKQKPEENVPLLEDFKCKLCSKVFSTKDILLNHEESVHTVHEIVMLNRKAKSPTPVSQHYRILLATHCRLWTYQQLYSRTFSLTSFGKLTTYLSLRSPLPMTSSRIMFKTFLFSFGNVHK